MKKMPYNLEEALEKLRFITHQETEHAVLLMLDDDYNIKHVEDITEDSSETECTFGLDKLFQFAFKYNCGYFIYSHNHPNNLAIPSKTDRELTYYLYNRQKGCMPQMVDHIIMCDEEHYSFREKGKLSRHPATYIL